jgi:hypothetical protein
VGSGGSINSEGLRKTNMIVDLIIAILAVKLFLFVLGVFVMIVIAINN